MHFPQPRTLPGPCQICLPAPGPWGGSPPMPHAATAIVIWSIAMPMPKITPPTDARSAMVTRQPRAGRPRGTTRGVRARTSRLLPPRTHEQVADRAGQDARPGTAEPSLAGSETSPAANPNDPMIANGISSNRASLVCSAGSAAAAATSRAQASAIPPLILRPGGRSCLRSRGNWCPRP